jgi:hydrogenase nickel incorporation protein HypB
MVERALDGWDLGALDYLFVENVGNLVCPASYDLGEHLRVVLMSVTEGEDKPRKYPTIFNGADLTVITKVDAAEVLGFDRAAAYRSLEAVRPGLEVLETSAKSGEGMAEWLARLAQRAAAVPRPAEPEVASSRRGLALDAARAVMASSGSDEAIPGSGDRRGPFAPSR